jgi:hypothetical protein
VASDGGWQIGGRSPFLDHAQHVAFRVFGMPAFTQIVRLIAESRVQAMQAVNTTLIDLYWQVGETIGRKIEAAVMLIFSPANIASIRRLVCNPIFRIVEVQA